MASHDPEDNDEPDRTDDEMFAHRERYSTPGDRRRPRAVSDFVRRAIENTVGSVQTTGTLSRDALNYVLQQGDRGKREILRIVAHEVSDLLRNVDLSSELIKVLSGVQLDVNASIRFRPTKEGSLKPEVVAAETHIHSPSAPLEPPSTGVTSDDHPKFGEP